MSNLADIHQPEAMVCAEAVGAIVGGTLAAKILYLLSLYKLLHHFEKKERRAHEAKRADDLRAQELGLHKQPRGDLALAAAAPAGALAAEQSRPGRSEAPSAAEQNRPGRLETITVVVENHGSVGGTAGVAEIHITGPKGSLVTTAPINAAGVALVSTESAGIPGTVAVNPGKRVFVISEHPVGKPEEAVVTQKEEQ